MIRWTLFFITLLCQGELLAAEPEGCTATLRIARSEASDLTREDHFAERVFAISGCHLQIDRLAHGSTLQRRFTLLEQGEIDLMIGVSRRPEREPYAHFSIPFRNERVRLWSRAGESQATAGRSLQELVSAGVRIIGPANGWFGQQYEELRLASHPGLILYRPFSQGFELLMGRRGELLLGDEFWPQDKLEPADAARLELQPEVVNTEPLHFVYSRKTVTIETVRRLDEAIRQALAEGTPVD